MVKFHVTFDAKDLLDLEFTGNTGIASGRQYMPGERGGPSFYAQAGELRRVAEHFSRLAEEAGE